MWTPDQPDDFSRFEPSDMMPFLDWFEREYENAIALGVADAFIEGLSETYLEALSRGTAPAWVETMLRFRGLAQWTYQAGEPLGRKLQRDMRSLIPAGMAPEYMEQFRITPRDIANVPPSVQQSFIEGSRFSMKWISRLSSDARESMRLLLSIQSLKNRNPAASVPLLEQVLRRDRVAESLGISPADVTAEQIQQWLNDAQFKVLNGISHRANLISRTESMRMANLGILTGLEQEGEEYCYVMPHAGSCDACRRLIDGRVFAIAVLKNGLFSNFGKKQSQWVASLPQHPQCRHSAMRVPAKFREAVRQLQRIPHEGIVLQWYGLPGGEEAMKALELPVVDDWLLPI